MDNARLKIGTQISFISNFFSGPLCSHNSTVAGDAGHGVASLISLSYYVHAYVDVFTSS